MQIELQKGLVFNIPGFTHQDFYIDSIGSGMIIVKWLNSNNDNINDVAYMIPNAEHHIAQNEWILRGLICK